MRRLYRVVFTHAQTEPHKRARKLSRVERELASLAPWAWDPLVGKHAPGNAMMRDFAEVAADKVVTTNTDTYDSYRFAAPAEPTEEEMADGSALQKAFTLMSAKDELASKIDQLEALAVQEGYDPYNLSADDLAPMRRSDRANSTVSASI